MKRYLLNDQPVRIIDFLKAHDFGDEGPGEVGPTRQAIVEAEPGASIEIPGVGTVRCVQGVPDDPFEIFVSPRTERETRVRQLLPEYRGPRPFNAISFHWSAEMENWFDEKLGRGREPCVCTYGCPECLGSGLRPRDLRDRIQGLRSD
jgi:hypothetical protein